MGTLSVNSFTVSGLRNSQIKVCLHYFHNRIGVKKEKEGIYIHFWFTQVKKLASLAGFKPQRQGSSVKRVIS